MIEKLYETICLLSLAALMCVLCSCFCSNEKAYRWSVRALCACGGLGLIVAVAQIWTA